MTFWRNPPLSEKLLKLSISPLPVRRVSETRKNSSGGGYDKAAYILSEPETNRGSGARRARHCCFARKPGPSHSPIEPLPRRSRLGGAAWAALYRPGRLASDTDLCV